MGYWAGACSALPILAAQPQPWCPGAAPARATRLPWLLPGGACLSSRRPPDVSRLAGLPWICSQRRELAAQAEPDATAESAPVSAVESTRIYVGNLDFERTRQQVEGDLRTLCVQQGEVVDIEVSRQSHRSNEKRHRGWAFVGFADAETARKAVIGLAEASLSDRKLLVRAAAARADAPAPTEAAGSTPAPAAAVAGSGAPVTAPVAAGAGRPPLGAAAGRGANGGAGAGGRSHVKLFIGNLPWAVGPGELRAACAKYGSVVDAKVLRDENGRSRGYGYVSMANAAGAEAVMGALGGALWDTRTLRVNIAGQLGEEGSAPPSRPRPQ